MTWDWSVKNPWDISRDITPLSHQYQLAHSNAHDTFLAGGWGSAKTVGGLLFVSEMLRLNPGCHGLVVFPLFRFLKTFLSSVLRPSLGHLITSEVRGEFLINFVNGSSIWWMSGFDIGKLESYNVAWAYVDEVGMFPDAEVLTRITARCAREPKAKVIRRAYTGTPHYGWLQDEFGDRNDKQRKIIHASTNDNWYTSRQFKLDLFRNTPASKRRAYIDGHFVPPGGAVYPEWDLSRHTIDYAVDGSLPIIPVIDWSPRRPHVLIVQLVWEHYPPLPLQKLDSRHPAAGAVIIDELIPDGHGSAITVKHLCQMIKDLPYKYAGEFICDPAGLAVSEQTGITTIRQAEEHLGMKAKYKTKSAERSVEYGIDVVKNLLSPMDGTPRLYVSRDLVNKTKALGIDPSKKQLYRRSVVNAMGALAYEEDIPGKEQKSVYKKDGIAEHACDDVRYLGINYFQSSRLMIRIGSHPIIKKPNRLGTRTY